MARRVAVNLSEVHKALYVVNMHVSRGNVHVILKWLRRLRRETDKAILEMEGRLRSGRTHY